MSDDIILRTAAETFVFPPVTPDRTTHSQMRNQASEANLRPLHTASSNNVLFFSPYRTAPQNTCNIIILFRVPLHRSITQCNNGIALRLVLWLSGRTTLFGARASFVEISAFSSPLERFKPYITRVIL